MANGSLVAAVSMVSRRCFSAMSGTASASQKCGRSAAAAVVKNEAGDASSSSSWVPDPVTGYYRPGNVVEEVDLAELRNILLNKKH